VVRLASRTRTTKVSRIQRRIKCYLSGKNPCTAGDSLRWRG
jgi:hypothetical protein